jgi:peptide deformylase
MGILKIARMGHPVLSSSSKRVEDPTAPDIKKLISDMVETMEDAPGIGLAAPQVHQPLRIVVFKVPELRVTEKKQAVSLTVLINPVIEVLSEDTEKGIEGCLSLPGILAIMVLTQAGKK